VEQVLMNTSEVGNNYVILLRRENNIDEMIVRVEVTERIFVEDMRWLQEVRKKITPDLKSEFSLPEGRALSSRTASPEATARPCG